MSQSPAERFSTLRAPQSPSAKPARGRHVAFAAATLALFLVTAKLVGFWPFSSGAETPADSTGATPNAAADLSPPPSKTPDPTPAPARTPAPTPPPRVDPPRTPPPQDAPDTRPAAVRAAEAAIAAARATGDLDQLRRAVGSRVWDSSIPEAARAKWLDESRRLAKSVVFSTMPMAKTTQVVVKDGDSLTSICARVKRENLAMVLPALVAKVNDVAPEKLRAGMALKIPLETLSLVVDKSAFRLWLLLGECHILDYPVGLGKDERTPEGPFTIRWKTKNPDWTDPKTNRVLRFGDPDHVIGSRWLGFATSDGARTGFGIHGTTEPDSIGKNLSDGCVRMRTADIEELFELVPEGARVVVRR